MSELKDEFDPPFETIEPADWRGPVVFNSPHSGSTYPREFLSVARLNIATLRRSEDSFVDALIAGVVTHGYPLMRAHFPRCFVDVNREQQLLLSHDIIVFQHPFYWYSCPALLKQWEDLVLEYGFAYGTHGTKLAGKWALTAITTGGSAEAYRTLRTNVEFTAIDEPIRTLLITSAIPGEGKTVTAANLAIAFALSGRRVLLVDADLRRPGLHRIFDLPNTRGLTTLLQSDAVTLDSLASNNLHERLRVLTSGPLPPNPAEIAGSDRMRRVFEKMQTTADLVIDNSTDRAHLVTEVDRVWVALEAWPRAPDRG